MSMRSATSAGVCCRPRVRLCGCRLPCASYTTSTSSSSSNNSSTTCIHGSHNSATSSANKPSQTLGCSFRKRITLFFLRSHQTTTATKQRCSTYSRFCICELLAKDDYFCTAKRLGDLNVGHHVGIHTFFIARTYRRRCVAIRRSVQHR